jgi:two-component system, chemotaxis family, response regulator Rcp1
VPNGSLLNNSRVILVIEDNPGDVRLMKEALRDASADISLQVAPDGEQALRYLHREPPFENCRRPSLIFLDLNLPRGTSKDILRQIKADPALRTIPVAVLTSSDADRDIREAYELFANCYLRKPVDLDSFITTVRSAVTFWMDIARLAAE